MRKITSNRRLPLAVMAGATLDHIGFVVVEVAPGAGSLRVLEFPLSILILPTAPHSLIIVSYWLDPLGSIPGRGKGFFSISQRPDRLWGPPSLPSRGYRELFPPGVKRQGRETDRSPPSSAEAKDDGAIPPLPHTSSLRGA
jgi:hypothetical protein